MVEYTSLYLFLAVCLLLMLGYPVAFAVCALFPVAALPLVPADPPATAAT